MLVTFVLFYSSQLHFLSSSFSDFLPIYCILAQRAGVKAGLTERCCKWHGTLYVRSIFDGARWIFCGCSRCFRICSVL